MVDYPENKGKLPVQTLMEKPLGQKDKNSKLVIHLQKMLTALCYTLGKAGEKKDGVNGGFGNSTVIALTKFQEKNDYLKENPDFKKGMLDARTAIALNHAMVGKWYDYYPTTEDPIPEKLLKDPLLITITIEYSKDLKNSLLIKNIRNQYGQKIHGARVVCIRDKVSDKVARNMKKDFEVSEESSEKILYINMPGFNAGAGYWPDRAQEIFKKLSDGRDYIKNELNENYEEFLENYDKFLKNPQINKLPEMYEKVMRDFEKKFGVGARNIMHQYWKSQGNKTKSKSLKKSYYQLAESIKDEKAVPALIPQTRNLKKVTFKEKTSIKITYETHRELRYSYYANVYIMKNIETEFRENKNRILEMHKALKNMGYSKSEAKIVAAISRREGKFSTVQTIDAARLSWGIIQFKGSRLNDLLLYIKNNYEETYEQYFKSYGIIIGNPCEINIRERNNRLISGMKQGVPKETPQEEPKDISVYDHNDKVWVSGYEGLWIIQNDPRYQAIFSIVGLTLQGKKAQMALIKPFIREVYESKIKFRGKSYKVKDIIKNEVAMFALIERKIAEGNIKFAQKILNNYLPKSTKEGEPVNQKELAREMKEKYLFSWNDVPGTDSFRLIEFLKKNYKVNWIKEDQIENIEEDKSIKITDKESFLSLSLNNKMTEVTLKIKDVRTAKFIAIEENHKLNIYMKQKTGVDWKLEDYLKETGLGMLQDDKYE